MAHECEIYEGGSVLELGYVIPKLLSKNFPKQYATVTYNYVNKSMAGVLTSTPISVTQ